MCAVSTRGQNSKLPSLELDSQKNIKSRNINFATFDCAILITFKISMENAVCSK